eukprot:816241-Amphidinium_carterae.1
MVGGGETERSCERPVKGPYARAWVPTCVPSLHEEHVGTHDTIARLRSAVCVSIMHSVHFSPNCTPPLWVVGITNQVRQCGATAVDQ